MPRDLLKPVLCPFFPFPFPFPTIPSVSPAWGLVLSNSGSKRCPTNAISGPRQLVRAATPLQTTPKAQLRPRFGHASHAKVLDSVQLPASVQRCPPRAVLEGLRGGGHQCPCPLIFCICGPRTPRAHPNALWTPRGQFARWSFEFFLPVKTAARKRRVEFLREAPFREEDRPASASFHKNHPPPNPHADKPPCEPNVFVSPLSANARQTTKIKKIQINKRRPGVAFSKSAAAPAVPSASPARWTEPPAKWHSLPPPDPNAPATPLIGPARPPASFGVCGAR